MVAVTLTGEIISQVSLSTTSTGAKRASFIVECQEETSLPLRYDVACFGKRAGEAESLTPGTKLLLTGRLTAAPRTRKVSLSVSHLEVLGQPEGVPDGPNDQAPNVTQ